MANIEYGVRLEFKHSIDRGGSVGTIQVPVTVYYVGRDLAGKLKTGKEFEARRMSHKCATALAEWLAKTTKYKADVVELIGEPNTDQNTAQIPNNLVELGEAISLDKIQQTIRDCVAQGIFSREQILAAVNQAI